MLHPTLLLALAFFVTGTTARATVDESMVSVPVRLTRPSGVLTANVPVLVVRPAEPKPHPLLLIVHGRGVSTEDNRRLGRVDYPTNARFFAALGYAVLIPTRIGYGYVGGLDIEATGPCSAKNPRSALSAAGDEMQQVLDYAAAQPWAAQASNRLVVGDSFGGLIALELATRPTARIGAVIAFSAGDGGDSAQHVDEPCDPLGQAAVWGELGKRSRAPALVLYSANDRMFGPVWPRRWFERWQQAGGDGQWVQLPADKNNGHFSFSRNGAGWHAAVEAFIKRRSPP
jgi:dienelactone hydrolase